VTIQRTTTQQQHPARATWRTTLANVLSMIIVVGLVAPIVAGIIDEELTAYLPPDWIAWIVATGALLAAVAGALTRIMAIPAVDRALAHLGLSSAPPSPFPVAQWATGDRVELIDGETVTIGAILMEPNVEAPSYHVTLADGAPGMVHESEIARRVRE
jgi:hypothetical protein